MRNYFFQLALSLCFITAVSAQDKMAEIGNKVPAVRLHLLTKPEPEKLHDKELPFKNNSKAGFKPMERLDSRERLNAALTDLRSRYAPFLQDLAPSLSSRRIRVRLNDFYWRKETAEDRKDFYLAAKGEGSWQKVSIPHYGPPLGEAVTLYRSKFIITSAMLRKGAVFLRFKGVDYKAQVFVNGKFCGSHEGVFAPFEFNVQNEVRLGENTLLVKVENDYPMGGHVGDDGRMFGGDKIYAATGPGYDDPILGWHHNPPAMGIYQDVILEARSDLHFNDVFVRPIGRSDTAEVWIEVNSTELGDKPLKIRHSLYGQNFRQAIYEGSIFKPVTVHVPGMGDMVKPTDNAVKDLKAGKGLNFFKFRIVVPGARRWNSEHPWLYQLQLELLNEEDSVADVMKQQFGMRSFTMDTLSIPKGMMYLDGKPVRLRGANVMGVFQQSVMKRDWKQLIDDILLAKLTNMNYIRLTQMPNQEEVYDYFDRLGLMAQTDLPVFGVLRKNKWIEAVKQAEEMERLVRSHPCNIMVTYINERFPNADGNPHRHLDTYSDYLKFFTAADQAILMNNPDRVIKPGDGDYDPPGPGLPDNHVYNGWYNGHGLGLGEMHKGYWLPVKPGWYYACGEFGSEGLDSYSTMLKYYPKEWLPTNEQAQWTPEKISQSQTWRFHTMWFNAQSKVSDWIRASQDHQAWVTRLTTEAFRRDKRMVSFAIHLFIDAWPAGWMKAIMDVQRIPKRAWFEYQHALVPLAVQLRTDRYSFFSKDSINIESWIVNDKNERAHGLYISYQLEDKGKVIMSGKASADVPLNSSQFQGFLKFIAPDVAQRRNYTLRMAIMDHSHHILHETDIILEIFPRVKSKKKVWIPSGQVSAIINEMEWQLTPLIANADVILLDDFADYFENKLIIDEAVRKGKTALFLDLPPGQYLIGDSEVNAQKTVMGSYYFASPDPLHPLFKTFHPLDFRAWYNADNKVIAPFLSNIITASGWTTILSTGSTSGTGSKYAASCERQYGEGVFRICQIQLAGRLKYNPVASEFLQLLSESRKGLTVNTSSK